MNDFDTGGIAWDGQPWTLAPCLVTFTAQITKIRPGGPYFYDGTVAGVAHDQANPTSDHSVWPMVGTGKVYAADVDEEGGLIIDELFENMRKAKDSRLKYAIHAFEGKPQMFSSYPAGGVGPWTWRPYTGWNPHTSHGHLSAWRDEALANDTTLWNLGSLGRTNMALLPIKLGDGSPGGRPEKKEDVKLLQADLNEAYKTDLLVDGQYGATTAAVVKVKLGGNGNSVNAGRWRQLQKKLQAVRTKPIGDLALDVTRVEVVKNVTLK